MARQLAKAVELAIRLCSLDFCALQRDLSTWHILARDLDIGLITVNLTLKVTREIYLRRAHAISDSPSDSQQLSQQLFRQPRSSSPAPQ